MPQDDLGFTALQQIMVDRMKSGTDMQQAQMAKLQGLANRAPETEEAERWAAMASAAAQVPPMVGGFGALLANIGGAYGKTLAAQEQQKFNNELAVAKAMDAGSGSMGSLSSLLGATGNVNVPGVGLVNRMSGEVVVPSSQIAEYNKLYAAFYKNAVDQKMANPEAWAQQQARAQLGAAMTTPEVAGGRTTPFAPTAVTGAQTPAPAQPATQVDIVPQEGRTLQQTASGWVGKLKQDEQEAAARGEYDRALELRKARLAIEAQTPPQALQYRDVPKAKMEEATAEVTGKKLGDEFDQLQGAASASAMLKTQLGALRELYKTPNLPEGAMGEQLQGLRSSLSTLGISIGKEVGAGDMINAIGGKMALLTRTAEGGNLMPGAMSDYEQRVLKSLVPSLNQTAEGRAALVDFLSDMADVRIRLASEANKLAQANRGILPPDWYTRRDRVLKEEQARLAMRARELSSRFKPTQGAK